MNCPTCGAENDADARFCAECGSSLENQAVEAAKAEQAFEEAADPDMTIMSMPDDLASEAKTVAVDQDQVNAAVEEASTPSAAEVETGTLEPATPGVEGGGGSHQQTPLGGDESGGNRRMWIIIGVVAVVILLCCCCSLAVGGVLGSDPGTLEDIIEELSLVATYLPLV